MNDNEIRIRKTDEGLWWAELWWVSPTSKREMQAIGIHGHGLTRRDACEMLADLLNGLSQRAAAMAKEEVTA